MSVADENWLFGMVWEGTWKDFFHNNKSLSPSDTQLVLSVISSVMDSFQTVVIKLIESFVFVSVLMRLEWQRYHNDFEHLRLITRLTKAYIVIFSCREYPRTPSFQLQLPSPVGACAIDDGVVFEPFAGGHCFNHDGLLAGRFLYWLVQLMISFRI
jgi:hypothetical protein